MSTSTKRSSTPGTARHRDIPLRRSMTQPSSLFHSSSKRQPVLSSSMAATEAQVINDENSPPNKMSSTSTQKSSNHQARKSQTVSQPLNNKNVQDIQTHQEPKASKVPALKRTNSTNNIPNVSSQSISRLHEGGKKLNLTKLKRASSYRKRPLVEKTIMYKTLEEISSTMLPKFNLFKKTYLLKSIHDNIFGSETFFKTPFGLDKYVPFTYCDAVDEGKPLRFIEDYLHEQVLPTVANSVASTNSFSSYQSSQFISDAKRIIAACLNANVDLEEKKNSDETKSESGDAMFFIKNSCSDAIRVFCERIGLSEICKSVKLEKERPVVLVSPNETDENIQTWKETGAQIVMINNDAQGNFIIDELIMLLKRYKYLSSKLIIVAVNMVSPITGVYVDENEILSWAHEYGALCFLNYEYASPFLSVDFNPNTDVKLQKDALYVDASKLIGGLNCSGILLMKKKLMTKNVVTHRSVDLISIIRTALVLKLKDDVGPNIIQRLNQRFTERALKTWCNNSNLFVLGPTRKSMEDGKVKKLAIFSFLIRHQDQYLHPGFVSTLLNDLFGIQTKSVICSDMHGQQLLGLSPEKMKEIENAISGLNNQSHLSQLKPGWNTLQINYFFDDSTVDFVVKAIDFVANNGWKFLPFYMFNEKTNEWNHRKFDKSVNPVRLSGLFHENFTSYLTTHRKKLSDVTFSNGSLEFASSSGDLHDTETANVIFNYNTLLSSAESLLREASNNLFALYLNIDLELKLLFGSEDYTQRNQFEHLRWFCLPSEALMDLKGISRVKNPNGPVFSPFLPSAVGTIQPPSQKK
ncbi:hypothetical protein FDP41_003268 [Naegleria fowleri]|uniref:Aminotransferase class V domain-containing protein n=1 Tax=Naegleria fowleri TaxID=5763 RepID=A0A6A5BS07_NAEFO|nr:uncharacterized protein FDP41_003268 [Naegleria fowleri]KAF0977946.1 hypothetical protein FDP41_003268 [Naegleria fowleri]CAG4714690.1 unnamed protein product [Naegleria fowleri]